MVCLVFQGTPSCLVGLWLFYAESVRLYYGLLSVYDVYSALQILGVLYLSALEIVYLVVRHISVYVENGTFNISNVGYIVCRHSVVLLAIP